MKKYKIIDKYSNQQISEFFDFEKAQDYLKRNQRLGKIGMLKGKEVFKIKTIDTEKQRLSSLQSRNRKLMRKEWFGI